MLKNPFQLVNFKNLAKRNSKYAFKRPCQVKIFLACGKLLFFEFITGGTWTFINNWGESEPVIAICSPRCVVWLHVAFFYPHLIPENVLDEGEYKEKGTQQRVAGCIMLVWLTEPHIKYSIDCYIHEKSTSLSAFLLILKLFHFCFNKSAKIN